MKSEEEQALDSLLRGGRVDPTAGDLARLEKSLSSQLGAPTRPAFGARGAVWKVVVFVAALGLVATPFVLRGQKTAPALATTPAALSAAPIAAAPLDAPPPSEATVSVLDLPNAPVPRAPAPSVVPTALAAHEESEASFLRRAQTTLAADPSAALALLDEYPSRYPHGSLAQEREVMAIDALARLGRMDEARARAADFEARYPHSAHESRLDAILQKDQP